MSSLAMALAVIHRLPHRLSQQLRALAILGTITLLMVVIGLVVVGTGIASRPADHGPAFMKAFAAGDLDGLLAHSTDPMHTRIERVAPLARMSGGLPSRACEQQAGPIRVRAPQPGNFYLYICDDTPYYMFTSDQFSGRVYSLE